MEASANLLCVCEVARVDVLTLSRVLINTNSITLFAVVLLSMEVLRVNRAHDIKAVTVVSSHNYQGVVKFANVLKVLDARADSVVELKKLAKSTVVIWSLLSVPMSLFLARIHLPRTCIILSMLAASDMRNHPLPADRP